MANNYGTFTFATRNDRCIILFKMGAFEHALLHKGLEIAKEHLPEIGMAAKEMVIKVAPYAGPTAIVVAAGVGIAALLCDMLNE